SSRLSFCRTVGTGTTLRKAAIHRDRPDRRRSPFLFYAIRAPAEPLLHARLTANKVVISDAYPKSPSCVRPQRGVLGAACVTTSFEALSPLRSQSHDYLSSILAPTFSRAALIFSASSFGMPSLTALGAAST